MLRFKILASAMPLVLVAMFARDGWTPVPRPCVRVGDAAVRIAAAPWLAELQVRFTDDPGLATVRVQLTENAAVADFAVVDGPESDQTETSETGACEGGTEPLTVAISASPAPEAPVIYLSPDGPADYRIFVRSNRFTAREAAALIVGAGRDRHQQAASL
jgi:hypothetical protein